LGAEQFGLSEQWKNKSDYLVSIPMNGLADSLNVAQAGTILLFEVKRQIDLSLEKN
jgi:TrmH family RNA methyltransferase